MAHILINTYHSNLHLFVDGQCLLSEEGTTQGDSLAMTMHESSVGLSSTTNPKPRGKPSQSCTGTPRYHQQKAEPPVPSLEN